MAVDPDEALRISRKDAEWRTRNRTLLAVNPVLVCANCGWKISSDDAKRQGIHNCPTCGSTACRVHCLDYKTGGKP